MSQTEDYRARLYRDYRRLHPSGQAAPDLAYYRRLYARQYGPLLPPDRKARILDLGAGSGTFIDFLRSAGYTEASGVEQDEAHVRAAKDSGIEGVEQGDAWEALARRKADCDCVLALDFLEHFRKDELFPLLDRVRAALKPGPGACFICRVPNADGPFSGRIRYGDLTHELAFTAGSIRQALLSAGFIEIEVLPEGPVVTGLRSLIRWLLWKPFSCMMRLYLFAESYSCRSLLTPNIIVRARVPS